MTSAEERKEVRLWVITIVLGSCLGTGIAKMLLYWTLDGDSGQIIVLGAAQSKRKYFVDEKFGSDEVKEELSTFRKFLY